MDLYFGSIVSVVAVFLFSVVEPENRIFVLGHIGKKMSTTIYILHYVFVDIMWLVLSRTENTDKKIISWIAPIIVSALSILLAYILGCIENRRKELL